ncbi:succinate dehydrogenase [ubiquinone] cytochrome b small subunit A, mitochondrial-like isoform X2 [Oscarella lobularis]|uniref:succinate dehydrogenase [ubiquinone] cytochrome b small subunit A, mitochondrial-like isoform X1 n=1 Tax=Oscarella lobularis TaxID=121494 RepID=UPI00331415DA
MAALARISGCQLALGRCCRLAMPSSSMFAIKATHSANQQNRTAVTVTPPKSAVKHWTAERAVAIAQIGFVSSAFVVGSHPVVDWGLAIFIPLHSYWGLSSIITDYTRKIFGDYVQNIDGLRKGILAVWAGLSLASFAGLAYLNTHDVGVCKAVYALWTQVQ